MALLKVLKHPDPFLKQETAVVESIDDVIRKEIEDMFETMYEDNGVGLAANQVGLNRRMFMMDCTENRSEPMVFINPEITETEGEIDSEEGCLSFPGIYITVKRARKITVKALDKEGNEFTETLVGLPSRCVQHEIDHLDGKTFVDNLTPLKRKMLEKKMLKFRKKNL